LGGRGGDTEIAHVTPGEVVIPARMQTPEVMAALMTAAAEAGVDPARLVVGSERNSINPQTGQAEFYYAGPEMEPNRQNNHSSAEQQVADIYVNRFPNDALWNGHVGIGVNTNQTKGFYPSENNSPSRVDQGLNRNVPGKVKLDDLNNPHDSVRIHTDPEQDRAVQSYIDSRQNNPGSYNLYDRNCTDFTAGALRAGGISVPSDSTPEWMDDIRPNSFFPWLQRKHGKPEGK